MSETKHPERLIVGRPAIEHYIKDLHSKMESYGDHRFLEGLDRGLSITQKLCSWLTADPPIPHDKLRRYVLAEHEDIVKQFRGLTENVKLVPALAALIKGPTHGTISDH